MIATSVWFDMFVVWANVGLSAIATVALLMASFRSFPELRASRAAAGVLAAIYCGSFIWLAFNYERSKEWSQLMRPVALLAWVIVWILPPISSMRLFARLAAAAKREP